METTINMPQSDIMAGPNINSNLLQAATNTFSSRTNATQPAQGTPTLGKIYSSGFDHQGSGLETQASATFDSSGFDHQRLGLVGQATPTSSSSPFDHQGSTIESSDSNFSQSNNSSNNPSQHSP